jgi:RNA polymerase sigma-70 factor, ECF subfamily
MYSLGDRVAAIGKETEVFSGTWADAVDGALRLGQASWPGVSVHQRAFGIWLADRTDSAAGLALLHLADLYLACALRQRDPAAIRILDRALGRDIMAAARGAGADAVTAAEVRQEVTADLLVGAGAGPRIERFPGRTDLRSWMRGVAIRTAWTVIARARADLPLDEEFAGGLFEAPEISALRERHAGQLAASIAEALAALTARQRTLLRLAYRDRLSPDAVGRMYAVPRAVAASWILMAREALFEETRRRVALEIDAGLPGVVRLVQSQVHVSLDGMWR